MTVEEFRKQVKANMRLSVEGKDFLIKEVVRFRFDDGTFYLKLFLSDDYVFADDLNENTFLLVKEIETDIADPFPNELNFDDKKFKFLFNSHAVAEEVEGAEIFKKGDSEKFWDYKAEDKSYLSLGINDRTRERMDFYGRIINNNSVNLR